MITNFKLFEDVKIFDFEVDREYNHKSKYKKSTYTFKTDNGFEYSVFLNDTIKGGKYLGTRIVEFSFRTNDEDPNNAMKKLTNNTEEVYKVMNTIFTCIKDFINTYFTEYICYTPTETDSKPGSSKSRARLYNHYFTKYFTNCEIERINDYYYVTLN